MCVSRVGLWVLCLVCLIVLMLCDEWHAWGFGGVVYAWCIWFCMGLHHSVTSD